MFDAFPETHDLWDVQQYANCLKKLNRLDEAEQVCEDVYSEFKDTEIVKTQSQAFLYIENLYAWIINDKYVSSYLTAGAALYKQINHITFNLKISLANPIYLKSTIV